MLSAIAVICSILSYAGLILTTKNVMWTYKFEFPATIAAFHLLLTELLFFILRSFGFLECPASIPAVSQWVLGLLGALCAITATFSLRLNSVPFHQLSQLLAIPCSMVHRLLTQRPPAPRNVILPLAGIVIGVGLFLIGDMDLNLVGSLFAIGAAVMTSIFGIQTNALARKAGVVQYQIGEAIALPSFVAALVAAISIEARAVAGHDFQGAELGLILLSGVFAVVVEFLATWLAGRIGARGSIGQEYGRAALVIALGFAMFPGPAKLTKEVCAVIGIIVALVAGVAYAIEDRKNQELETRALVAFREEEEQIEAPVALIVPGMEFEKAELDHDE
jgi:hypothetical protein